MRIRELINRALPKTPFARNVSVLVSGTAFAQAITVLMLPVITRLYTPEDFSILAVYSSLLGIISAIACLRLEVAIPLPEDNDSAINLLLLALAFSITVAALTAVVLFIFPTQISALLNQPHLQPYFWMLPLGIWLASSYAALQFWATRKKKFPTIAHTRIAQAIGGISTQLGFGFWSKLGPFGLLLGQLAIAGFGVIKLGRLAWQDLRGDHSRLNCESLYRTLYNYSRFPKYSTFEALANSAAIELPVIIIAATAIGAEAGFLLLAMKAASIPMSLIGGSIAQVYLSHGPEERRAHRLSQFTTLIITRLVALGAGPLVAIGIMAPSVIPLIFGPNWARTGVIISWMVPWFTLQFLVSPISMSLHVTDNQRLALTNQLWGAILRIGLTILAGYYFPKYVVEAYAISGAIFYFGYLAIVLKICEIRLSNLIIASRQGLMAVVLWTLGGMVATFAIHFFAEWLPYAN